MPSYAVTGTSRGIGVCDSLSTFYLKAFRLMTDDIAQLGFVRALSADPTNTVFALVRNLSTSNQLQDLVTGHPHKNIHIIEADTADINAIKVCLTCFE